MALARDDVRPDTPGLANIGANPARLRKLLMIGGLLVVALGALVFWLTGGRYVSTDDAYVGAPKLLVSADVSGTVTEVKVREGDRVKAGDVLFRLDPQPFQIAVASAQSALAQTALDIDSMKHDYQHALQNVAAQRAQLAWAQNDFNRQDALLKANATARATYDQASLAVQTANATLASLQQEASVELAKLGGDANVAAETHPLYLAAKAKLDEAQRQLDHTVVKAPFDGIVTQSSGLQPGMLIVSAMAAFMPTTAVGLVGTNQLWIDANLKETDLQHVKEGDPVDVAIDTFSGRTFHGHVQSVAPATGAQFSALPAQNTSGNWVKVVQRVPVRIEFDKDEDISGLRAGLSVYATIDTGHSRSLSDLF